MYMTGSSGRTQRMVQICMQHTAARGVWCSSASARPQVSVWKRWRLPNLVVEQYHGHYDGDGGDHDVCHCGMQEVDDIVDVRAHEVDNFAALNGLLGPAVYESALSPSGGAAQRHPDALCLSSGTEGNNLPFSPQS